MLFSTEPTDLNIIMKRICFIAQFPPPIHGLSKAVATLTALHYSQNTFSDK